MLIYQYRPESLQAATNFRSADEIVQPDLEAEKAWQSAVGVERELRPGLTLQATGFYTRRSDLIIDNFIDNFIVVPLTLFVIEVAQVRWKAFLRWVLLFQIAFATIRFISKQTNEPDFLGQLTGRFDVGDLAIQIPG